MLNSGNSMSMAMISWTNWLDNSGEGSGCGVGLCHSVGSDGGDLCSSEGLSTISSCRSDVVVDLQPLRFSL